MILANTNTRRTVFRIALMLPAVIVVMGLVLYPLVFSFISSLHRWDLLSTESKQFIGFENYVQALSNPEVIASTLKSLIFVGLLLLIGLPVSILLALLLNIESKLKYFLRVIVWIPCAIPQLVN